MVDRSSRNIQQIKKIRTFGLKNQLSFPDLTNKELGNIKLKNAKRTMSLMITL